MSAATTGIGPDGLPDHPVGEAGDEAADDGAVDGPPLAPPAEPETVGTGSYVAVSCVAAMGLLLLVLIAGLLLSRWLG